MGGELNDLRVAILGPFGSYTHEAAHNIFGPSAIYEEQPSISDVFSNLSKHIPVGMVPHENSIFGTVNETYALLRSTTSSLVRGEVTLKIEHCLLVKRGVKLHEIKRVFSHEQALGQCRSFIAEILPGATIVKTASTSAAAQIVLTELPDCAAICSTACAKIYQGLEILFTGIQDVNENTTAFFLLIFDKDWELPSLIPRTVHKKALIRLSMPFARDNDYPERDIINYLKILDLPATRISRQPSLEAIPFHYVYFAEVFDRQIRNDAEIPWKATVEIAIERLRTSGAESVLIGFW